MKKKFQTKAKLILMIAAVSLSSGICSSEEEDMAPDLPVATLIEMEFPNSELTVGETVNFTALVKDSQGNILSDQILSWTSSNPNILSINSSGLAEAKSKGTANIEVANQTGVKVAHEFTVIEPEAEPQEPHSFEITPTEIIIEIGQKVQIEMKVFDIEGDEIENPEILYKSYDDQVSTVSDIGLVEGIRAGSTKIHIEVSNKSAEIPVTVTSKDLVLSKIEVTHNNNSLKRGEQVQFSAKGFDQFDQEMSEITYEWTTSNGCIASIDEDGLASGYTPGNVRIYASVGEITGSVLISVPKSDNLYAESFEGKWSMCKESDGNNIAIVELELDGTNNDITRMYKGTIKYPDGTSINVRGNENIAGKSISISWSVFIQGGERTALISNGTFIDELAVTARHTDRLTPTYDVRLSKIEE